MGIRLLWMTYLTTSLSMRKESRLVLSACFSNLNITWSFGLHVLQARSYSQNWLENLCKFAANQIVQKKWLPEDPFKSTCWLKYCCIDIIFFENQVLTFRKEKTVPNVQLSTFQFLWVILVAYLYIYMYIYIYLYSCIQHDVIYMYIHIGWWFGTFFIFPYIGNNNPNWLIFFRGVQTTNQYIYIYFWICIMYLLPIVTLFLHVDVRFF